MGFAEEGQVGGGGGEAGFLEAVYHGVGAGGEEEFLGLGGGVSLKGGGEKGRGGGEGRREERRGDERRGDERRGEGG